MKLSALSLLGLFVSTTTAQVDNPSPDTSRVDRTMLFRAIAYQGAYYAGAMVVLQNTWYRDRQRVPLHFYDDSRGYLQVDKFGHAFGAYVMSYVGFHWLRNAGLTRAEALVYGGSIGFILQMPIEIMDGIHEGWGFSWSDVAANAAGSGLVVGQELLFNEQIATYKFSYWESEYSRKANGYLGESTMDRLLKDYNGHTYWISVPVYRLVGGTRLPNWLSVAVGYGANGMYGEYENIPSHAGVSIPHTRRYRQILLSLDVDWTSIETDSPVLKTLLRGMTLIKMPLPTIEYNSLGELRWYWLYY